MASSLWKQTDRIIRRRFTISTWDVRTLYKSGALHQLLIILKEYKTDLLAVQETRWIGNKTCEKESYTIFSSGHSQNHTFGTAL